ncbi:MAG TPA: metallophosphoesterase [Kofleriaceae bacterium]
MIFVAIASVATVNADEPDEPTGSNTSPVPRGALLLQPSAPWQWQVVAVPRIAPRIGALAVNGLDVVAGRAPAPLELLGDPVPPPPGWPHTLGGGAAAIRAPGDDERIAAAFGVTTFTLGAQERGLEMLELRLRYQDGVAVWINGVEVVRQALADKTVTALADHPHGPEWETFYIPVAPPLLRHGANTLAVEVHPSGRRFGPMLAAELYGRRDRGIRRGPILAEVDAVTATIAVETDPGIAVVLEWGVGDKSDRRETSPAGSHHVFKLSGLPANTRISYRALAGATQTPRYAFRTLPPARAPVRIGIYGDVRGGHATHRRLVDNMLGEGLDAVAVTGDMVLRGSDEGDWQRFFAITRELMAQLPYYPAVGNHDLGWDGADVARRAEEVFALPAGPPGRPDFAYWYSRTVADVHMVFLDSNNYERPEQETWLEADLAQARKAKVRAILVFTHDGPYSRGYHGGNAIARDRYVPILTRYNVDLVLSGHDHLYQRGELAGLRYVVTGGGGASLYSIRCGVSGRPKCKTDDGMISIFKEHHYLVLAIGRDLELCPRRVDGTLLEKCVRFGLRR